MSWKHMKKPLLIGLGVIVVLGALLASRLFRAHQERALVRARYEAMCLAVRDNDMDALAKIATPKRRADYYQQQGDLWRVSNQLGFAGSAEPDISLSGDRAWITLNPRTVFWVLRTGNSIEMAKENGEWCFTGKVSID